MPGLRFAAVLSLVAVLCSACDGALFPANPSAAPSTAGIVFRVVDQAAPLGDLPAKPAYTVITRIQDWEALQGRVPTQALEQGRKRAAFDKELYLLAFGGVKGSSGYAINVTQISVVQEQYIVIIAEESPGQDTVVEPAMTLPYILLAVSWDEFDRAQRLSFIFKDRSGNIVTQQDIQLPSN